MNDSVNSGRPAGRPRKVDGPRVPYDQLDALLVHGESLPSEAGGTALSFPSYRELARRFGCSHSLIATYSRKRNCLRRRKEAQARVLVKTDQKLVELRATALALSRDEELQIIDEYLASFGKAVSEGRVRFDDPAHFDRFCRLKEYLQGGADSRQEIHAALSLQDLQTRHARMLRASGQASTAERGEVIGELPAADRDRDPAAASNPPAPPTDAAAGEVPGQFPRTGSKPGPGAPPGAASGARSGAADHQARVGGSAPHGANVALTGPDPAHDGELRRPPLPDQEGAS